MLEFEVIEKKESDFIVIRATCKEKNYVDRSVFIKPTNKGLKKRKINKQKIQLIIAYKAEMMLR